MALSSPKGGYTNMKNVIDAKHRFRTRLSAERPRILENYLEILKSQSQLPATDRPILAERLGAIAAQISHADPLKGARLLFNKAGWGDEKWQKRKRLIRLPGEIPSSPNRYGTYEASGATWARLASAAAELLAPNAMGTDLDREKQRVARSLLFGTTLIPGQLPHPSEAAHVSGLISEISDRISRQISRETRIQQFWETLRASPFTLQDDYSKAPFEGDQKFSATTVGQLRSKKDGWRGTFAKAPERMSTFDFDWAIPIVRIGALRRRYKGSILVPPPYLISAFLNPNSEEDLNKISNWYNQPYDNAEYNRKTRTGWLEMSVETTRSVYVQAYPRADGEVALWLSVNESFFDNLIPVMDDSSYDLTALAYKHEPLFVGAEPFEYDNSWATDSECRDCGLLRWPPWCRGLITDPYLWNDGVIGIRDMNYLYLHDHSDEERSCYWTARPPQWFYTDTGRFDEDPDGIGGWLDDESNHELQTNILINPAGLNFLPLIQVAEEPDVPCKPNTIADAILRNFLAEEEERLDRILCDQATLIAETGIRYHQERIDNYRSRLPNL